MTLLFIFVLGLAFLNGANDVSKGIATLVGSGITKLRSAVIWGTVWTVAGALTAAVAAQGLIKTFSGNGIVSPLPNGSQFLTAVTLGALLWVCFATRMGMPVSTTHAITGGLIGAGLVAVGTEGIQWTVLGSRFLIPLAVSPVLSLALIFIFLPVFSSIFAPLQRYCLCVDRDIVACATAQGTVTAVAEETTVIVAPMKQCDTAASIVRLNAMDTLHWLSAAATSFARGLNDAPKILGLGVVAGAGLGLSMSSGCTLVALAMGAGSLLAGFRVTETLAQKVTPMSPTEGFVSNLITSFLVIFASKLALPVSTTHVSSGAIIGLGLRRNARGVQWKTVREMLLAWLVTLPTAGLLAALIYWVLRLAV